MMQDTEVVANTLTYNAALSCLKTGQQNDSFFFSSGTLTWQWKKIYVYDFSIGRVFMSFFHKKPTDQFNGVHPSFFLGWFFGLTSIFGSQVVEDEDRLNLPFPVWFRAPHVFPKNEESLLGLGLPMSFQKTRNH